MIPKKVHVTFPLKGAALKLLSEQGFELDVFPGPVPREHSALLASAAECEGVLCSLFDRIDREYFEHAPKLKVVAQFAAGYDNVDVEAATEHGVQVTNTPDVLTEATAEMAWTLLLAAARRLGEGERLVRSGEWTGWEPGQMLGAGVTGKTLGIIGAGRIGTAMGLKSAGFEMPVLYTSRKTNEALETRLGARRVSLDELLADSDFVSIHVALSDETHHMIGRKELARMKPEAVLINTARGPVVDEAALVEALEKGEIAAAGLDVYEKEPQLTPGLAELPNAVLAPHIGSATRETREAMELLAVRNLIAVLKGEKTLTGVNEID